MSAYKQFLTSDVIVSPFVVNKGFNFISGSSLTGSNVSIDRFLGTNITSGPFISGSDPTTGYITTQYQRLVFNSIKELYYSNYFNESITSSIANLPILIPGSDPSGDQYIGAYNNPAYDNYLQTDLTYPRFFPASENDTIAVISIPVSLFGEYIQPGSFIMTTPSGSFYDDTEGNIISASAIVGNIVYPHGLIILTGNYNIYNAGGGSAVAGALYGSAVYGTSVYGSGTSLINNWSSSINTIVNTNNITISFSSSYTIYETQYKCTIRENEFNFTLNPSAISGSYNTSSLAGQVYDFITGSDFSPYITTVGLYDEAQNLLAIGKLSQPIPSSPTTDTTILINLDM